MHLHHVRKYFVPSIFDYRVEVELHCDECGARDLIELRRIGKEVLEDIAVHIASHDAFVCKGEISMFAYLDALPEKERNRYILMSSEYRFNPYYARTSTSLTCA